MQSYQRILTNFVVRTQSFGLFVSLIALAVTPAELLAQNGTWTNLASGSASGSWTNAANWNSGVIASNADNTADFSTLDLTAGSTVTLDGSKTIGNMVIGDLSPSTNWTFNAGAPSTSLLTLAVSAGSPIINVTNQIATFGAPLVGTSGFTKTGGGTLRLNGATTGLSNLVVISSGILQIGTANALGTNGNYLSNERIICTNSGTLEIIQGNQPNNKHVTLAGTGNGGTNGALYASLPATGTSTRWGLSSWPIAGGASANSSPSSPAITLTGDTTIRIDSTASIGAFSNAFIPGYITGTTNSIVSFTNSFFTLTKTGNGRISLDRGVMVSNIVVKEGFLSPNNTGNGNFNGVQRWTVKTGASLLNWQNLQFNQSAIVEIESGAVFDVCGRNDTAFGPSGGPFTQNIGFLNGAGTITCGSNGNYSTNIVNIFSNSVFTGPITSVTGRFDIVKNSAGTTLTLGGTNTYNGVSTVNAGTWLVDGKHTGGMSYVVAVGATLGGNGTINPPITFNGAGALLVAGDNGGTLTVANVTGAGDVIVSNANLTVLGQLNNSGSGSLNSLYLSNSTTTALLQQNGTEASIYTSALNVDGVNNTLWFTTANPALGQFPFIKYSSIGGLNGFAGLQLQAPAGISAYLSNNVGNFSIDIVVTNIPALVWRGTPTGDWSIGGSANWLNGVTPTAYSETAGLGPFVIFDDTAAGTSTVNLTTTVTPKGITVNNTSKSYSYTGSGLINGSGSLEKNGTNTLTIANTASNTFSGTVTINNGAVSLGNGGAAGNLGAASIVNNGTLIFNRSDTVTFGNAISGSGALEKDGAGTVSLSGVGNVNSSVIINAGTLALAPAGTITVSGDVTGNGAFGITSAGTVILNSSTVTYGGGTIISNGTLQINNAFPPSGNITDNGTLAVGASGTLANNISGSGGVSVVNGASLVLGGANSYLGPTRGLGGSTVAATASSYPAASTLILGSTNGAADIGSADFTAGNPVVNGLVAGGNSSTPGNQISLSAGNQAISISGNLTIGNVGPSGASAGLTVTGTGASLTVNTNGGVIQLGLGSTGSGINPDNVLLDVSGLDNFIASLGSAGAVNMGTLDGNPGPPTGATVVNQLKLAAVSNSILAGTLTVGAGGRQLVPELFLGAGTNLFDVNTFNAGGGGRDGSYVHFGSGTGGLRLRAYDGASRAVFNVGVNPATGTSAAITNTVDFTGHTVDLLLSTLTIGDYNNAGVYQNSFSFDTGVLDTLSTSLSVLRNNNGNAAASGSTLNIGGGTARLGPVNLTASAAYGTLNISGGTVTVANITSPGAGVATLIISGATLNLSLTNNGNPVTAPVAVDSVSASGTVNLGVNGTNFVVGQFPLISYSGSIGGDGFTALSLSSLPSGVGGYLSNNLANPSVDLVITNAPPVINPLPGTILASVSGSTLTLSWPTNLGWLLQQQTNPPLVGLSTNWVTVPGSSMVTSTNLPISRANGSAFFRMVHP